MKHRRLVDEPLTHSVIGAFYEVYNALGYGFMERLYISAMERELRDRGHLVAREVGFKVMFKEHDLGTQRLDMIVDGMLVVETKATYELHPIARRQVYNYLRATGLDVGLLLHFGPQPRVHRITSRTVARSELDDPLHPIDRRIPTSTQEVHQDPLDDSDRIDGLPQSHDPFGPNDPDSLVSRCWRPTLKNGRWDPLGD
jgi:GxxExxY protein